MTSPGGPYVQAMAYTDRLVIQSHDHQTDTVTKLPWHWQSWQQEFEVAARGIAEVYELCEVGGVWQAVSRQWERSIPPAARC